MPSSLTSLSSVGINIQNAHTTRLDPQVTAHHEREVGWGKQGTTRQGQAGSSARDTPTGHRQAPTGHHESTHSPATAQHTHTPATLRGYTHCAHIPHHHSYPKDRLGSTAHASHSLPHMAQPHRLPTRAPNRDGFSPHHGPCRDHGPYRRGPSERRLTHSNHKRSHSCFGPPAACRRPQAEQAHLAQRVREM